MDIRIIAATNCDLEEMVKLQQFREDLFYRVNVIERSLILNPKGPLSFDHLNPRQTKNTLESERQTEETDNLDEIVARHIRRILSKTKGKVHGEDGAAALLGINSSTLRNRMNKVGITYGRIK